MSAAAGLQIPSALTTGGEAHNKARAARLHGAMHALNTDIGAQVAAGTLPVDSGRYRQWKRWITAYGRWYGSVGAGFFSGWSAANVAAMLDSYDSEMLDWRSWYGRTFRTPPTGEYTPPKRKRGGGGAGLPATVPAWVWAGLGVAGLYAAAKLAQGLR
jgi:hypothetical protein